MIYLNGAPLNSTFFPDSTSQVWKLDEALLKSTNWFHIKWDFSHEGEFMRLAQLKMLLDSYGHRSSLRIKYLPYGRQDKKVSNDTTFALHSFAKLLNLLAFEEIIIMDPHSLVAIDLIKNSRAEYPIEQVMRVANIIEIDLFAYPDLGAVTKYTGRDDVQKEIYDYPYIYGEKVRDQSTGDILSYKLICLAEIVGKKILIVDDICDGGMTFKIMANDLLKAGAMEVHLFVTHGIFSKGLRTLKDSGIDRIFTQNGEASEARYGITYRKI